MDRATVVAAQILIPLAMAAAGTYLWFFMNEGLVVALLAVVLGVIASLVIGLLARRKTVAPPPPPPLLPTFTQRK